jgi:hypothetical protein
MERSNRTGSWETIPTSKEREFERSLGRKKVDYFEIDTIED